MLEAFTSRLANAASSRVERRFENLFPDSRKDARENALAAMRAAGAELEREIRVRGDGRGIFLVRHPHWGACVLKTTFSARSADAGLSNLAIARWVASADTSIFPAVLDATADYTLEEFIDGRPFRQWMETSFRDEPTQAFLDGLRAWSEGPTPWPSETGCLAPHEIREIIRQYVMKCIGHRRFLGGFRKLGGMYDLWSDGSPVAVSLQWLIAASETVRIPRGKMCGDMGNVNLLVQHKSDRIYNIDYEFMGPGHRGFDCAYLVSSLAKLDPASDTVARLSELAFSPEYMGSVECAEFFSVYASTLTAISRKIYRHAKR
jgi:hypothetical protein